MSTADAHREHVDSVGAYALGALPELEAQVFERHLMACEACHEELQRLNQAVEALPRSVAQHQAPPSLKARLMAEVNADAARSAPARRRWRPALTLPRLRPAMAVASLAAVGVLAGFGISQLAQEDGDRRTLQAQVDAERIPGASASLSVPEERDEGSVLEVEGMPDAGKQRVYQVWVERDGRVESASIFDVDERGAGAAAVPDSLEDASAVMVTREPRGGSKQPTERPVLRVDI